MLCSLLRQMTPDTPEQAAVTPELQALLEAVEYMGGQPLLAAAITVEMQKDEATRGHKPIVQQHVWSWVNRQRRIPPTYVLIVEKLTGVSRHRLRPDKFPPPAESAP